MIFIIIFYQLFYTSQKSGIKFLHLMSFINYKTVAFSFICFTAVWWYKFDKSMAGRFTSCQ